MAIDFAISVHGPLLRVTTRGRDESLEETQAYGLAVLEAALTSGCSKVLCDERELDYALSTTETFDLACGLAQRAPALGRVAIVCKADQVADGRFFETVAVNRGLLVRVFTSIEEAETWLASR